MASTVEAVATARALQVIVEVTISKTGGETMAVAELSAAGRDYFIAYGATELDAVTSLAAEIQSRAVRRIAKIHTKRMPPGLTRCLVWDGLFWSWFSRDGEEHRLWP